MFELFADSTTAECGLVFRPVTRACNSFKRVYRIGKIENIGRHNPTKWSTELAGACADCYNELIGNNPPLWSAAINCQTYVQYIVGKLQPYCVYPPEIPS